MRITLYEFKSPELQVHIEAFYNPNSDLVIEGQDLGKTVLELMGDIDYEYIYTIRQPQVVRLAALFDLTPEEQYSLLQALKERFSDNSAFSRLGKFMDTHNIEYEFFSWR